ncbi:hypothetical protein SO802_010930 [Lithocarpus litseifolius]|uniref:Uncharacterized protein n=1 Tax=Lithocarpus litseifolius TaxID=425828 RepID=A0AAW2DIK4_9ROSI
MALQDSIPVLLDFSLRPDRTIVKREFIGIASLSCANVRVTHGHCNFWVNACNVNISVFTVVELLGYFDVRDGVAITKLAVHCVDLDERKRPTMTQIVNYLQGIPLFSGNYGDAILR